MRVGLCALASLLLCGAAAHADTPVDAPPLSLPVLEALPAVRVPGDDAPWPDTGVVDVRLSVEVADDGTILSVSAPDDIPPAFRQPAIDAARGARLSPAHDATGQPVSARIELVVRIDRAAPPPLSIEGTLLAAGSSAVLAHHEVEATGPDGHVLVATANAQGHFQFAGLADGPWTLRVGGGGLRPTQLAVDVREGTVQTVDLRVVRDAAFQADTVGEEIIVWRPEVESTVTERALPTDLARVLPGTNGDVVKVVQSLPGVARAPLGTGNLIIRGTAPEDSVGFVDGTPLPMVFHFGGLSTVIHGRSVAEVGYIPGNAGVRYGRFLGGLVDIRTRDARPEYPERAVHIDLFQAGLFVDTPASDHSAVTISARRSYIDTVLQGALDARGVPVRAPVYSDVQARWLRVGDDGTRTELLFLRSHDTFEYMGTEYGEEDPLVDLDLRFWRLRGRLVQRVGDFEHELSIAMGVDTESLQSFSYDDAFEQVASVTVREEWYRPVDTDHLGLRVGLDLWSGREVFLYNLPTYGPYEGGATPFHAPALYGEVSAKLGRLTATPGLRGDLVVYPLEAVAGSLDPRLHTRFDIDDVWAILVASGTYSRLPAARQMLSASEGNPSLLAERAWQNSVGIEVLPYEGVRFELTGFANVHDRRIVGREDRFQFQATPFFHSGTVDDGPYQNTGTATIFGGELLARMDAPRFTGWLAATVSRSRRVDAPGEASTLFQYDQPLVLTALGTTPLPKNWRLGSRLRFTSGNPYSPVANRFQNMESREFVPVYSPLTTERLAPFFGIDLRVDKTFTFEHWRLTTSLDIQNISIRPNPELPAWNSTYTAFEPITGLPPIPVFGLEGAW